MFEEWVEEACKALAVEPDDVDTEELLDLSREIAHGVERRAAPVATFLLGLVVGRGADYDEALAALRETAES
ncbi:MAG TPA: DUF6457 domain-containing protein [Actinomycetota bacterium]|jgi:hypothetical protein|nr:DUF6457 domain-containing protein [Actinomycetota bacterium]